MKKLDSYRKLRKVSRKYWKRNAKKEVWKDPGTHKKMVSYWTSEIWCYYLETELKDYEEDGFRYDLREPEIPEFYKKVGSLIGKTVKVGETTGSLKGIAFTNNGAYYAIESQENIISLLPLIEINEVCG